MRTVLGLIWICFFRAFAATSAIAADAPIFELRPADKWHLDYLNGSCTLARTFGDESHGLALLFTRFAPGDTFNLMAFGKPFAVRGPYQDVRVAFGTTPADSALHNRLSGTNNGTLPFVDLGSFTLAGPLSMIDPEQAAIAPAQEESVTTLTIGPQKGHIYRILLGSMRQPMAAMRTCTDDLVKFWGYDPVVIANLSRKPEPETNPHSWLQSSDYPTGQLAKLQLGGVQVRLDVDDKGKAVDCRTLQHAGDEAFAAESCSAILRHAHFRPALDKVGKPVKSFYITRVNWLLQP